METKVSQESLQSRLSFFTTGSSFQATETILATGTTIWKPALRRLGRFEHRPEICCFASNKESENFGFNSGSMYSGFSNSSMVTRSRCGDGVSVVHEMTVPHRVELI